MVAMAKKTNSSTSESAPQSHLQTLAIAKITRDPRLQSRERINPSVAAEYAEAMEAGDQFPPLLMFSDGSGFLLVDGFHRLEAAKLSRLATLRCEVLYRCAGADREIDSEFSCNVHNPAQPRHRQRTCGAHESCREKTARLRRHAHMATAGRSSRKLIPGAQGRGISCWRPNTDRLPALGGAIRAGHQNYGPPGG
jgi:hypothetical protein